MADKERRQFHPELAFVSDVTAEIAMQNYGTAIDLLIEGLRKLVVSPNGITDDQFQFSFAALEAVSKYKLDLYPKPENPDRSGQLFCSFCGQSQEQVGKMIAGPGVYICDDCTAICSEIIANPADGPESKINLRLNKKLAELSGEYLDDKISLQDFQSRLEPMLGAFDSLSDIDNEFIKETINQIEPMIYTLPAESQKAELVEILPRIHKYLNMKTFQEKRLTNLYESETR